jgi:hypothetical protein
MYSKVVLSIAQFKKQKHAHKERVNVLFKVRALSFLMLLVLLKTN